MNQQEFEARIGQPVSSIFYMMTVEPAYMASSYTDKDDFAAAWNSAEHGEVIRNLSKVAESNRESMSAALKGQDILAHFIADQAHLAHISGDSVAEDLRSKAVEWLGKPEYIKYILSHGYELTNADRDLILNMIP